MDQAFRRLVRFAERHQGRPLLTLGGRSSFVLKVSDGAFTYTPIRTKKSRRQGFVHANRVFERYLETRSLKTSDYTDLTVNSSYILAIIKAFSEEAWPLARLSDEEADQSESGSYIPQDGDQRQIVEKQIKERRGQQVFRQALCERYGNRCMVTRCEVLAVLEAAHIKPYRGENDNHPENGLLLRSDIHTLFDLDLIAIEPNGLQVHLHPSIKKEYGYLSGKVLSCRNDKCPSSEALKERYEEFKKRLKNSC